MLYTSKSEELKGWLIGLCVSSNINALIIYKILNNNELSYISITVGYSNSWIQNSGLVKSKFGMKFFINAAIDNANTNNIEYDENCFRKISSENIFGTGEQSTRMLPRFSSLDFFNIDKTRTIIKKINGVVKLKDTTNENKKISSRVVDVSDCLSINLDFKNITDFDTFLKDTINTYKSNSYKKDYEFIDWYKLVPSGMENIIFNDFIQILIYEDSNNITSQYYLNLAIPFELDSFGESVTLKYKGSKYKKLNIEELFYYKKCNISINDILFKRDKFWNKSKNEEEKKAVQERNKDIDEIQKLLDSKTQKNKIATFKKYINNYQIVFDSEQTNAYSLFSLIQFAYSKEDGYENITYFMQNKKWYSLEKIVRQKLLKI